jgi:putative hydrolase of the HAD superfamily
MRNTGVDFPEVDIVEIWKDVTGWSDRRRLKAFALEYELTVNPVYPMIHFGEFLAECRKRSVGLGLISNAQFYTRPILEHFLGDTLEKSGFDPGLLFFSFACGRAKPSPHMFERAAAALEREGVPAGEALYVGNDMAKDMVPAAAAGFRTALFAGDSRSLRMREDHPDARGFRPDLTIVDLLDIIDRAALADGKAM